MSYTNVVEILRRPAGGGRGTSRALRARLCVTLTVLATFVLLVQCDWVDPFAEYRGVNLIENRGFTIDDFSEAYRDGTSPVGPPYYTRLAVPGSYGGTNGLEDTSTATLSSIRSLGTVNLMPNGDFEDGTTDPWITDGSGLTVDGANVFASETGAELTGTYIRFEVQPGQGAAVDLDILSTIPVVHGGRYFLQFIAKRHDSATTITLDHGDDDETSYNQLNGISWVSERPDDGLPSQAETFPDPSVPRRDLNTRFTITETPNYLYLGSPAGADSQRGFLDEVRIGRLDNVPMLQLSLSTDGGAGLDLVPGRYTFSVYVKSEQASEITPVTGNRFRAGQIVLGANGRHERVEVADGGWSQSQWSRVSTIIEFNQEDFDAGRPLLLQMTTIDTGRPVVGSVLVARPTLTLGTQAE